MKLGNMAADVFFAAITEQIKLRLIRPQNDTVRADPVQADIGIFEEFGQFAFTASQGAFGTAPLGNIAKNYDTSADAPRVIANRRGAVVDWSLRAIFGDEDGMIR